MTPQTAAKQAEHRLRNWVIRALARRVARNASPPNHQQLRESRVLLIRQDRIGDVLVSTPMIAALRKRYPAMTLDILVSPNNHMAVDGIPGIRKRWLYEKSLFRIVTLLRVIRKERYDVAVDLMDNPSATSTVLCLLAGARWTVGIEKDNDYVYDVKVPLRSRSEVHIVRRIAELLRPFGIDPDKERLRITFEPGAKATDTAKQLLASIGLAGKKAICINISAGSRSREWGKQRYIDLVRSIAEAYPSRPIVIASAPRDRNQAGDIASSVDHAVLLPPTPDFLTFAACLRHMGLIVTPDTAVVHLAAAYSIPSVILYIQTDPGLRIWDPYGSTHVALISDQDTLETITPADVCAAMKSLIRGRTTKPSGRPVKKR